MRSARHKGWVDSWLPEFACWAYADEPAPRPIEIGVRVDGVAVASATPTIERPDVIAGGPESDVVGFSIPLAAITGPRSGARISIHEVGTGDLLFESGPVDIPDVGFGYEVNTSDSVRRIVGSPIRFRWRCRRAGRLAVLAAHTSSDTDRVLLQYHVDSYRRIGFVVAVVDTGGGPVVEADLVITRSNVGWDFASWATFVELFGTLTTRLDELILTNDSCAGPLGDLGVEVDKARRFGVDVAGLSDGRQGAVHLQSFFLMFGRRPLRNQVLRQFFATYSFPSEKDWVVKFGEVDLSRVLRATGYSMAAVHDYSTMCAEFMAGTPSDQWRLDNQALIAMRKPINLTYAMWDRMLDAGFPFVKWNIFGGQSHQVGDVSEVEQSVMRLAPPEIADAVRRKIAEIRSAS